MLNRVLDQFDIVDRWILILLWKSHIYYIFFEVEDVTFVLLECNQSDKKLVQNPIVITKVEAHNKVAQSSFPV
jgi:hypothetical protein